MLTSIKQGILKRYLENYKYDFKQLHSLLPRMKIILSFVKITLHSTLLMDINFIYFFTKLLGCSLKLCSHAKVKCSHRITVDKTEL